MQKIVLVGTDFHPPQNEMAFKLAHRIANRLSAEKKSFRIVSIQNNKPKSAFLNTTIIPRLPFGVHKAVDTVCLPMVLAGLVFSGYRTVHFVWTGFNTYNRLLVSFLHLIGAKVVWTVLVEEPWSMFKDCDAVVCQTEKMQKMLLEEGVAREKIFLVPPFSEQIQKNKKKEKTVLFASVPFRKDFFEKRGIFLLLDAFEILQKKKSPFRLRILNRWIDGAQFLQDEVKKRRLDNVEIKSENGDIHTELTSCGVVAVPYIGETIPDISLSAVEGLGHGCPAVVIKTGLSDLIQRTNAGIVVKQPTPQAFSESIEQVFERYDFFSENAFQLAKKSFDPVVFGKRYLEVYERVK